MIINRIKLNYLNIYYEFKLFKSSLNTLERLELRDSYETKIINIFSKTQTNDLINYFKKNHFIKDNVLIINNIKLNYNSLKWISNLIVKNTNIKLSTLHYMDQKLFYLYYDKHGITSELEDYYNQHIQSYPEFFNKLLDNIMTPLSLKFLRIAILTDIDFEYLKVFKNQLVQKQKNIELYLMLNQLETSFSKILWISFFDQLSNPLCLSGLQILDKYTSPDINLHLSLYRCSDIIQYYQKTHDVRVFNHISAILRFSTIQIHEDLNFFYNEIQSYLNNK